MGNGYADAAAFRQAAVQGQVGIDPDSAHTVLNKIRAGKDAVEALLGSSSNLGVAPKLGANPVGQAIATKYADRGSGGGDSYAHALHNLYNQYDQAEQGILTAMRQYQQFDDSSADTFRGQV